MRIKVIYNALLALICIAIAGCTSMDFILPQGPEGPEGPTGKSAYEVWVDAVHLGQIDWPADKTDIASFFLFLKGKDGVNGVDGKSAYELWLEQIQEGVEDPHNPGKQWDKSKNSISDFWYFLTGSDGKNGSNGSTPVIGENGNWFIDGKDTGIQAVGRDGNDGRDGVDAVAPRVEIGANGNWYIDGVDTGISAFGKDGNNGSNGNDGSNGLSVYDLWVKELTEHPENVTKNGEPWPPSKNSLADFWEFLRGNDGVDGEDGKPGEIGKPGTETVIINGVPNVVAQFSQSEFGEYVRTTDGGVLYRVYDEAGEIAPGAVVQGLPGIENKEYTADENGEFIVPREDLPSIQDINARWGTTRSVSIAGKTPVQSARNTYVPNKIDLRIRVTSCSSFNSYFLITTKIERKLNPDDEWQQLPSYLPNVEGINLEAPFVYSKNSTSPKSDKVRTSSYSSLVLSGYDYKLRCYYKVISNILEEKNGYNEYWSKDEYFTIRAAKPYYGIIAEWNGTSILPPIQMSPIIKSISLKTFRNDSDPSFASFSGTLDYSHIDFTRIIKSISVKNEDNGMQYVEVVYLPEANAKALKVNYVALSYSSSAGTQKSDSSKSKSSFDSPDFNILSAYLNSTIDMEDSSYYFIEYTVGKLVRVGTTGTTFEVQTTNAKHPKIKVTYSY